MLGAVAAQAQTDGGSYRALGYAYLSPEPGSQYAPNQTTLFLMRFMTLPPTAVTNLAECIRVTGASSGFHPGTTKIASDNQTVIFNALSGFDQNELVTVSLAPQVDLSTNTAIAPYQYQFMINGALTNTGTITARGDHPPNATKAMAFDDNFSTEWQDLIVPNGSANSSWIQYVYPGSAMHVVNCYALTSANDNPAGDPGSWQLYGVDAGANLHLLDTESNQSFSYRLQPKAYAFTNTTAYRGYRLLITRVNNPAAATSVQLAELELIPATGSLLWECWLGIPGSAVSNLTSNAAYPGYPSLSDPLPSFNGPVNWAQNYGARVRGYITAPNTGAYQFWIASDDNSELWFSTNASPANARLIASVPGFTSAQAWTVYASQQSTPFNLQAGQQYYIEARHKQGGGGDNLAVGWAMPGQSLSAPSEVIPGEVLSPAPPLAVAPEIVVQPQSVSAVAGATAQISATVLGPLPLAYQWQLNSVNLLNDASFSGVNSNILTILNVAQADAGSYRLIVTNSFGSATSSNAVLSIETPSLVGEWLGGAANLADVSGYSAPGTHDGYIVGASHYRFTNDVPSGKTGQSLVFYNGDTGLAISNSSTLDARYVNTFDNPINNAFSVTCWAKGFPGQWSPWVSKFGETEAGWQLRDDGSVSNGQTYSCFTVRNGGVGANSLGTDVYGNPDDMATRSIASDDGNWHLYAGIFSAATGLRSLYVDGVLAAQETGNAAYTLAAAEHLCIGAKDSPPGNSITNFSSIEIFDVRIYNYPLSQSDIAKYYGQLPAVVNGQPQPLAAFTNTTKQLSVAAGGTLPIEYQWQLNGVSLANNANYSGVNSNILTITGVTPGDAGEYSVIVWNQYGTNVSSNALVSIVYPSVVGEWFNGDTNLNDISGYTPTNTHDGFAVTSAGPGGTYAFTTNVPPYRLGQSLSLGGTTAIAITNSATTDGAYTNTYDAGISGAFSVAFWANGVGPGGANWVQWVSKDGYNNDGTYDSGGWSIGIEAWSQYLNFSMNGIDAGGISYPGNIGDGLWGNGILESPPYPVHTGWHHYAGTYNAATGIRCTYYDGALVAYQAGDAPYNLAPAEHLIIGGQQQSIGYDGFETSSIYDVRIYNYAISSNDVQQLLAIPAGTPAQITQQPAAAITTVCEGVNVQIAAVSGGSPTITNQWQFNGTPLVDGPYLGAIISGSATSVLTIADVTTNNQGVYTFATSNAFGGTASAGTTLTVGVLPIATVPTTNLVGAWLTGAATLADTSGYSPMGAHDASVQSGTTYWTSDVPPIAPAGASSLYFKNAGLIVSNSSTLAKGYVNTFDDIINTNGMTVTCWAKGYPGGWNPWVSKYGENGHGWQLRVNAANPEQPTWTIRGTGGNEDMNESGSTSDVFWHFYAGTYSPVTSNRLLYVDGLMVVSQTGQGPLSGSPTSFLMIGAKDSGGDAFGNYFTGEIYGVQIFDAELTTNQIGDLMTQEPPLAPSVPVFNLTNNVQVIPGAGGSKVGGEFVISWSTGSLWESTNLATSWIHLTNATSPYTNIIGGANEYFKLSNP